MASSGDYYDSYKSYKKEAENLQKDINKLNEIRNKILNDFDDEQRNTNNEIDDLTEDLDAAIKECSIWNGFVTDVDGRSEASSTVDPWLDGAADKLNDEINALNQKKSEAESKRDQAYRDYEDKKKEEWDNFWGNIFG